MHNLLFDPQTLGALALVFASALWFGRGFLRALLGRGGCASGGSCGSCRTGGCSVAKFEAIRIELERKAALAPIRSRPAAMPRPRPQEEARS